MPAHPGPYVPVSDFLDTIHVKTCFVNLFEPAESYSCNPILPKVWPSQLNVIFFVIPKLNNRLFFMVLG